MTSLTWKDFRKRAAENPARIALADGKDQRVLEASTWAKREHVAEPMLVDPSSLSTKEMDGFVTELRQISKFKMLSNDEARARVQDPLILGCLYVKRGVAEGFVGGATRSTADTLRAVFSIVGLAPRISTLFGFFLIQSQKGDLVLLADCAVVPDPSPKQLAQIGIGAARAYEFFTGMQPKVAFLSFSTHGSAEHPFVSKIRQAVQIAREKDPGLSLDGEWQADGALDQFTAQIKGIGNSPLAGKANVLIAPDLNCGNIAYKLVQRLGGCRAVGPVLWGTSQPANDLSRGCSAEDIVDMMALTTLQVQKSRILEKPAHGH